MENNVQNTTGDTQFTVGFILADRFTLTAFASFVDVLRLSADEGDGSRPILCSWSLISATMNPVYSSCGVALYPSERLGEPDRFDYIVVVGGLIREIDNLDSDYVSFLKKASSKTTLIGLCTGSFILQKLGLMNGRQCCVSWFHHNDFLEYFEGKHPVSDQIFVVDRDRITCSGGTSSAHVAAYLVEKHVDRSKAHKSLQILIIDQLREQDAGQPGLPAEFETTDDVVRRALLYFQYSSYRYCPVDEVASWLGVTRRQLERKFQSALGLSPGAAGRQLRVALAVEQVKNTDETISRIAAEFGFSDSSHLNRVFRRHTGYGPLEYRSMHRLSERKLLQ